MTVKLYFTTGTNGGIWTGKPNKRTATGVLNREESGVTEALYGAAASDGDGTNFQIVVVGIQGSILLSNRVGVSAGTWTKVHQAAGPLYAVAWGNDIWVAVGKDNLVYRSTDGSTWTQVKGAFPGATWNWVAYGGGQFIAVGGAIVNGQSVGAMMSSTNGISWSRLNSGTTSTLQGVAYSPTLNKWVAVGDNGTIVSA